MMNMSAFMLLLAIALSILSCKSQESDNLSSDLRGSPPHHHSPPPHHHPPPPPHHHSPPPPHHSPPPPPPPPQYTYLILAMQWPPSYCKGKRCRPQVPGRFTLHGLWPQHPAYAGSETLTDDILSRHRKDLLEYWPDLFYRDFDRSKRFWTRQYNEHGKYCTTKFTADQYIARTLALGKARDLHAYLYLGGITPDEYRLYDPARIAAAVRNRTRTTPDLQCEYDPVKKENYLLEIRLCYDHNGINLINCRGAIGSCGHRVYYPSAPRNQALDEILEMAEDIADI